MNRKRVRQVVVVPDGQFGSEFGLHPWVATIIGIG
jgi:hypothetical protein